MSSSLSKNPETASEKTKDTIAVAPIFKLVLLIVKVLTVGTCVSIIKLELEDVNPTFPTTSV